jgi:SAM-dependent methyltransferase
VIEFTGERVVPGQVDDDLWAEHLSRYAYASRWAMGARVLDIGCGTGYGTAELAREARLPVGVDLAPQAIHYAASTYSQDNVHFVPASATALPFADASFDLVTAFEIIEHLDDWRALLSEARRVLGPEGIFLVSTPNKEYYTESRGVAGANPFHAHEFEFSEFQAALAEFFPHSTILLQNHVGAFAFYSHGTPLPVDAHLDSWRGSPEEAHFYLGVCSAATLPPLHSFVYVPRASNVLRDREKHIESLQQELSEARTQFAELHRAHDEQKHHLEEQNQWALRTGEELQAARERIVVVQDELEDRTRWALKLAAQVERFETSRWVKLGRRLGQGKHFDERKPGEGNGTGGGA